MSAKTIITWSVLASILVGSYVERKKIMGTLHKKFGKKMDAAHDAARDLSHKM